MTRPAYFVAANSVATEELRRQARRRSVHGIEDEVEFRIAQALPVHQFFKRIEIRRAWFERVDEVVAWGQRRHAFLQYPFELFFDLRNDPRHRAAAVAGFVLDAVPSISIVACPDYVLA